MRGERLEEQADAPQELNGRWLLSWDGDCGFCRRWVQRALRLDHSGRIVALPYQQCTDWLPQVVLERSPVQAHLRSPDGRYWGGGDAAIRLIGVLGYPWAETLLGIQPLRALTGLAYRYIAAHRRLMSRWGL